MKSVYSLPPIWLQTAFRACRVSTKLFNAENQRKQGIKGRAASGAGFVPGGKGQLWVTKNKSLKTGALGWSCQKHRMLLKPPCSTLGGGNSITLGFRDPHPSLGLPHGSVVKNPPANAGATGDAGSILGWEDPVEWEMQPAPVFLPGRSHGQRSLVGCSLWGPKSQSHGQRSLVGCSLWGPKSRSHGQRSLVGCSLWGPKSQTQLSD